MNVFAPLDLLLSFKNDELTRKSGKKDICVAQCKTSFSLRPPKKGGAIWYNITIYAPAQRRGTQPLH